MNFEINLIFLIYLSNLIFPNWPKSHEKNLNILKTKRAFKMKWKAFFMIFKKGLSIKYIAHFLEGESPTLKVSHKDRYVRSSRSEMFFRKVVLKICSKFTREQPSRSVICNCNFIEIALQHGCSPVDLLHIFRTPFLKNTSGRLLLIRCDTDFVFNGCF